MNTRHLLLTALFATCALVGCTQPVDMLPPTGGSRHEKVSNLPLAPMPHAPGEGNLPSLVTGPWKDRPSKKPWSELIVGNWLHVNRDDLPGRLEGWKVWEFTKDGKFHTCYSYPAAPKGNFPGDVERSTEDYRVNGNVLFPTSFFDDEARITESTTFIESLTANELRLYAVKRVRRSLLSAKAEAQVGKITLEQALAEVLSEERTPTTVYVRLKDEDK